MEKTTQAELIQGPWNRSELLYLVQRQTGVQIGERTLRRWLKWCFIRETKIFSDFDLAKLVFFAFQMKRFNQYAIARDLLVEDLRKNAEKWRKLNASRSGHVRPEHRAA